MRRKILTPVKESTPRDSLYLIPRDKWEELQGNDMNQFYHAMNGYGDGHQFTQRQFQNTLNSLVSDASISALHRRDPGPLATFYSESEALEKWSERVPIMGMWTKNRMPVVVYARGGGEAPSHRMQLYATQVTQAVWEEEEARMFGTTPTAVASDTPVYNHTMHTMAQRLFSLLTGVWDERFGMRIAEFPVCSAEDLFPVFNVTHDEWSEDALRIMCCGTQPTWATQPVWEGRLFYPEHPNSAAGHAEACDDRSWAFHSALHFPGMEDRPEAEAVTEEVVRPDPTWKDTRTVLHVYLGSQRDDYWVDSSKCPNCHQRLIIHADKAQCPTGRPTSLTVKCPDCKGTFTWP